MYTGISSFCSTNWQRNRPISHQENHYYPISIHNHSNKHNSWHKGGK